MKFEPNMSIIGNKTNEKKFLSLNPDERFEVIKETMNSIVNILVFNGIPVKDFSSILRAHAELLDDKIKMIKNRGKQ